MKTILAFLMLLLCPCLLSAQIQIFEKTYGTSGKAEFAYDLIETPDGGYMMVGITMNNPNPTNSLDGKIKKVDADGNLLWEQIYTGMQSTNDFLGTIVPRGNNYLVAGSRYTFSPLPPWYLKAQFWLLEINSSGTLIQQKNFGGDDDEASAKIIATSDGGFLMLGYTRTFGTQSGGQDVWLLKLNNSLDSVWSKTYDLGGEDAGVDIMPFNNKYIILANSCTEDCNTTAGGLGFFKSGAFYMLIDTLGNLDTVYNISPGLKNHFKSIQPTNDGGAVIAGSTDAVALNYAPDLWVLKLNANLDTIWTRTYGDSGAYDGCRGVFQQPDGNYIAGGYSQSFVIPGIRDFDCPWVMKLNPNGDSIWSFISGTENNDGIMQIIPASDGSIVATGYYGLDSKPESLFNLDMGEGKFYLLKLSDTLQSGVDFLKGDNRIVLFPNPARDKLTVDFFTNSESPVVVQIFDISGKCINKIESNYCMKGKNSKIVDIKNCRAGLYLLLIRQDNSITTRLFEILN